MTLLRSFSPPRIWVRKNCFYLGIKRVNLEWFVYFVWLFWVLHEMMVSLHKKKLALGFKILQVYPLLIFNWVLLILTNAPTWEMVYFRNFVFLEFSFFGIFLQDMPTFLLFSRKWKPKNYTAYDSESPYWFSTK